MTISDLCLFLFWCIALLIGASRGFSYSLIGPCSFIIGSALAFFYYSLTHNLLISVLIGVLGPLILGAICTSILNALKQNNPQGTGPLSSITGALVTLCWTAILVLPVFFILALLPPIAPFKSLHDDIHASWSLGLIRPFIPESTPSSSGNAQARMQSLLKDPVIAQAVRDKNYAALINNPKFMTLIQDPQFVRDFLATASK